MDGAVNVSMSKKVSVSRVGRPNVSFKSDMVNLTIKDGVSINLVQRSRCQGCGDSDDYPFLDVAILVSAKDGVADNLRAIFVKVVKGTGSYGTSHA